VRCGAGQSATLGQIAPRGLDVQVDPVAVELDEQMSIEGRALPAVRQRPVDVDLNLDVDRRR
jgi:hypothetical protein